MGLLIYGRALALCGAGAALFSEAHLAGALLWFAGACDATVFFYGPKVRS